MRIVLWDIETFGFDFSADKGFILCGSYKTLGRRGIETAVRVNLAPGKALWDDKLVCQQLYRAISEADMWVTHNGKRFDVPFLNTRLLKHGLNPLPPVPHFDTCEVIWKKLKMRARLDSAQKFFGWGHKKTDLNLATWTEAASGDKRALREVVRHCEADIRVLEDAYMTFRVLGYKHPNIAAIAEDGERCPYCGKRNTLQRRGYIVSKVRHSARYQCQSCGGWSHGAPEKIGKGIIMRPVDSRA